MMNTVPAKELKRRGIAGLEEALKNGPVHLIKNNHPVCVVLTEDKFEELIAASQQKVAPSLWDLLERPATGKRSAKEIKQALNADRNQWDQLYI